MPPNPAGAIGPPGLTHNELPPSFPPALCTLDPACSRLPPEPTDSTNSSTDPSRVWGLLGNKSSSESGNASFQRDGQEQCGCVSVIRFGTGPRPLNHKPQRDQTSAQTAPTAAPSGLGSAGMEGPIPINRNIEQTPCHISASAKKGRLRVG